jgi:polygalacturonase
MASMAAADLPVFNVRGFGAKGDGRTLDTLGIQAAFDAASQAGGGRIVFGPGTYLSGSLALRSNIEVVIEEGAELRGAPNDIGAYFLPEPTEYAEYQDFGHSHLRNGLLVGENVENVSLLGRGRIDGGGIVRGTPPPGGGDKLISLRACRNVRIRDLTLYQGGHFAVIANGCENLEIAHVVILTSRDGINIIGSRDVRIHGSRIFGRRYAGARQETVEGTKLEGGDDAIALKNDYALGQPIPVENVRIWNCELSSGSANGIQFGSETVADFRDIRIWNITIEDAGKAGIGITSNDGATIEDVHISNVTIVRAKTPLFINLTQRMRRPDAAAALAGRIRNVTLENIVSTAPGSVTKDLAFAATISGLPDSPIENVTLRNIRFVAAGGKGEELRDRKMPYPERYSPREMGDRPSWGLYVRHARGIVLENVFFELAAADGRPALHFMDVDGLRISGLTLPEAGAGVKGIRLQDARNVSFAPAAGQTQ